MAFLVLRSSMPANQFRNSGLYGPTPEELRRAAQLKDIQRIRGGTGGVLGVTAPARPTITSAPAVSSGQTAIDAALNAAREQKDAELAGYLNEYDYNRESLLSQREGLEGTYQRGRSGLLSALEGAQRSVAQGKESSQNLLDTGIAEAASTAEATQRKNRNVLRSLGILGSSAAAELLSRPMNEFDKQRATLVQGHQARVKQLDDFLIEKTNEHASMLKDLEAQYAQLIEGINRDLRFNQKDKANAVKTANAALSQRIAEIKNAQLNWEMQVGASKQALGNQLLELDQYQAPTADLSLIEGTGFTGEEIGFVPQTVGIAEDPRRRQLLGSYGYNA